MLADELDYVVGVDPQRDVHALAVVEVGTGGVVFETTLAARQRRLRGGRSARRGEAPGRRAFAVEGSGS